MDAAQNSKAGLLLDRALDLLAVLKIGIHLSLEEIDADELFAMLIVEEERNRYDNEKAEDSK